MKTLNKRYNQQEPGKKADGGANTVVEKNTEISVSQDQNA